MNARFTLIALLMLSTTVLGQWTKVVPSMLGKFREDCCGFGFIHHKDGRVWAGADQLFVSPDSGLTWTLAYTPSARITEINFLDRNIGIIGTEEGVDRTDDGGITWKRILTSQYCFGAQFAGSPDRIAVAADNAGFFYSNDGGRTWDHQSAGPHPHFVLTNEDGSAFAFAGGGSGLSPGTGAMRFKAADVNTWASTGLIDYDCFYAVRHHCSGKIFLMNEEGHIPSDNIVSVFSSSDECKTWDTVFKYAPRNYFTSGMAISPCCALYCQTLEEGILRTTDEGVTWTNIGGPSNTIDSRVICAVTDNIIIAADADGAIWRTTNSGGDSLYTAVKISTPRTVIDPKPKAEVKVPIFVSDAHVGKGFSLVVHYDTTRFEYKGSFANSGDPIDVSGSPGRSLVAFKGSDITATSGVMGYSMFKIMWNEPFYSVVRFDSVRGDKMLCEPPTSETIVGNYPPFSVDDESIPSVFTIRPNPSDGIFTINSTQPFFQVTAEVFDLLGKEVVRTTGNILPELALMLDLRNEVPGTYYVRLQCGDLVEVIQLIRK